MISLKDLINEFGGSKNLTLAGLCTVFLIMAGDRYFDSIETRFEKGAEERLQTRNDVRTLQAAQAENALFRNAGERFTAEQSRTLASEIARLENSVNGIRHELIRHLSNH